MSKLMGWLKSATVKVLDPNREDRVAAFADEVWRQIKEKGKGFNFKETMSRLGADVEDNPLVTRRVYEKAVTRAWADSTMTDRERQSLDVIGQLLQMSAPQRHDIERRQGLTLFEGALGFALADGELDATELQSLTNIAAGLGTTTRELMLHYFRDQGEAFLRNLFAAAMQEDRFTQRSWQRLLATANALGLVEADLRNAVQPQAKIYVEHVLADAKADGRVTDTERHSISWLLETFGLGHTTFSSYVWGEVGKVDLFFGISQGRLPSIEPQGVALRAGEIAHYQCPATYLQVKNLQSGVRTQRHDGYATITDTRLLFSSMTKSFDLNHRRVVSVATDHEGAEIRAGGRGSGYYYFQGDPALAVAIYEAAVGRANQTIVEALAGAPSRHIAREVRQRVWQRYGGRCADCGATQYLEFDHIVPVGRGGSSTEANVQLLCRGCNSKKSDHI